MQPTHLFSIPRLPSKGFNIGVMRQNAYIDGE